jgi:hypothetical protein
VTSRTTLHEERIDLQKRLEIDHRRMGEAQRTHPTFSVCFTLTGY